MEDLTAHQFVPPQLGVGLTYTPATAEFVRRNQDLVQLLEFEPQTTWCAFDPIEGPFRPLPGPEMSLTALNKRILVHSVGVPLAGSRRPSPQQCELLAGLADRVASPWISEHLSIGGTPHRNAGFLLPPLQTEEGILQSVINIGEFSKKVGKPVAVETGVSYLPLDPMEMSDGEFVARVSTEANCGILLDLHNIYCNEQNGRSCMNDFLDALPLERVWEVHLAGGMSMDGFWLDAHSGHVPDKLSSRLLEIFSRLPNLGAVVFEIYPAFIEQFGEDALSKTLDEMHMLWSHIPQRRSMGNSAPKSTIVELNNANAKEPTGTSMSQWENDLCQAIDHPQSIDRTGPNAAGQDLYAKLARSFRSSLLMQIMPRTICYIVLTDPDDSNKLIEDFFQKIPAQLYAVVEARAFLAYLQEVRFDNMLVSLAEYEIAIIDVELSGKSTIIRFSGDPRPLFEALDDRLPPPSVLDGQPWEIELTPSGVSPSAINALGKDWSD